MNRNEKWSTYSANISSKYGIDYLTVFDWNSGLFSIHQAALTLCRMERSFMKEKWIWTPNTGRMSDYCHVRFLLFSVRYHIWSPIIDSLGYSGDFASSFLFWFTFSFLVFLFSFLSSLITLSLLPYFTLFLSFFISFFGFCLSFFLLFAYFSFFLSYPL